ncbi:hypothetical protein KY360_00110 [Candidatus Woesearchaeota archaeon]|nr:hypothetical protein [Candidatus Woesearchaeota archaeon]
MKKKKQNLNILGKIKRFAIWSVGIFFGLIILLVIIGFLLPEPSDGYTITFFAEDTKEALNGDVYLGSKYLGKTSNGTLEADVNELSEGIITLKWEYKGRGYETQFQLEEDDLKREGKGFYIKKDYMSNIKFDASKLDYSEIESKVVGYINTRRKNQGLSELKSSSRIADSAREYAEKVGSPGFKPSDKKSALETLSKENIFTFYTDGVIYGEELSTTKDEDYIAEQIVISWFKDPWAKEKLLEQYSDIGIGVYLKDKLVVAVGFLSVSEFSAEGEMEPKQCSGVAKIYNENLPFDKDIKVRFELESTKGISAYFVTYDDAQQDCIKRKSIDSIKEYRSMKEINEEFVIPPGTGLMLKTSDYGTEYSYSIRYISWG